MNSNPHGDELSYDGYGINGPDQYRTRIATFSQHVLSQRPLEDGGRLANYYGPLFAAAPRMKALLEKIEGLRASPMQRDYVAPEIQDEARAILKELSP